jgi:hypothetical protein
LGQIFNVIFAIIVVWVLRTACATLMRRAGDSKARTGMPTRRIPFQITV